MKVYFYLLKIIFNYLYSFKLDSLIINNLFNFIYLFVLKNNN